MERSSANDASVDADVMKAVRMAISATEKKDYGTALTLFNHVYGNPAFNAPPDGLSYWGLCIAVAEKQTKKGVDLCRNAMQQQFYDSTHHANLVKLHLAKGNRKLAVHALEEALRSLPGDSRLTSLRGEIGYRQRNPVPVLPRDSGLNKWLGTKRRGRVRRDRPSADSGGGTTESGYQGLGPIQIMLIGFLGFALVFSTTFYYLYQQAYG